MRNNRAMHVVAVFALDGVMPFELAIPHRILGSATAEDGRRLYQVLTCSIDGGPVRTSADFAVAVDHGPEILRDADTVVIPPFGSQDDPLSDELLEQVESVLIQMRQRTRLVSLCGAAYLLAALGRLDGRPATTHWQLTTAFRQVFPAVSLKPDVLFVDDGDVLTAAGAAAGVDLCLHLVRRDHGADTANRVARHCVVAPHREGGQRQFIEHAMPPVTMASTTRARQWALDHLDEPLTLEAFAQAACMGVRTFTRRFRQETAMSPNTWLLTHRIHLARRLLETTDLPIDAIAHRSGFGTPTIMRKHFHRLVGIPPSTYRRAFTPDRAATATD